jgi:hypothetical protein
MKLIVLVVLAVAVAGSAMAAESFKDVPKDHWAAESVQRLADAGIVQGFADKTFRGDKPLTRYEFAAALERFVEFFQQSQKPILPEKGKADPAPTSQSLAPKTPAQPAAAKTPAAVLKDQGFLPKDSPVLKDGNKPVTANEMADALASVAQKLIELRTPEDEDPPPTGNQAETTR